VVDTASHGKPKTTALAIAQIKEASFERLLQDLTRNSIMVQIDFVVVLLDGALEGSTV
jgi:hypothetical protein